MATIPPIREKGRALLEAAYQAAQVDNWDGVGSKRVEFITYKHADEFLRLLPSSTSLPNIVADTDGEILFEWDYGRRQVFSVSIGWNGTLSYAGLFGDAKIHGTEPLRESLPSTILNGLERLSAYVGS
jgi:hypothetical protein